MLLTSLYDTSKKQAKERVVGMEEAAEKIIFYEKATGV